MFFTYSHAHDFINNKIKTVEEYSTIAVTGFQLECFCMLIKEEELDLPTLASDMS